MRKIVLFTAVSTVSALCLAAACGGDDDTTPCTTIIVTNGGNGGAGGEVGGNGGTGGTQGTRQIGESCQFQNDCADGLCLAEEYTGWGTGYCSMFCNSIVTCPEGTMCISGGSSLGQICLTECDASGAGSECGSVQSCYDLGDGVTGVCIGGCSTAADCPTMGTCDTETGFCSCTDNTGCPTLGNCEIEWGGYCAVPEVCDNTTDDDGDSLTDCEDAEDCATACAAQYTAACDAATAAQASNAGDTADGTAVFVGSCTGGGGALESIYTYTPTAADAFLHIALDSATDQGIYLRSDCADPTSELACTDMQYGGAVENMFYQATSTDPISIFVDGYGSPLEAGPFTLTVEEMTVVVESEANNTWQTADVVAPGSMVSGSITPSGDDDFYSVVVPANAILTATIVGRGTDTCGGTIDSEIQILGTDGVTELVFNDDVGMFDYCSAAQTTALAAGTYFVRVAASAAYSPDLTFDYGVYIQAQ